MKVIEQIIPFDELGEIIAAFNVNDLQVHAAYFFQTELLCVGNRLILPSATRESGWALQVQPRCFEVEEEKENPWLDFLNRRYSNWILVYDM